MQRMVQLHNEAPWAANTQACILVEAGSIGGKGLDMFEKQQSMVVLPANSMQVAWPTSHLDLSLLTLPT